MSEAEFAGTFGPLRGDAAPNGIRRVLPGDVLELTLPHSEVCMHMRVAGKRMLAQLTETEFPMVQLFDSDGRKFSAPITPGEAGIYRDPQGFYLHRHSPPPAVSARS